MQNLKRYLKERILCRGPEIYVQCINLIDRLRDQEMVNNH